MSRYLLDTNILSDLIRNPSGLVAARIAEVGEANICTSIVVAGELRFGIARRGSPRLTAEVEGLLTCLDVLPLERPVDEIYGRLRAGLEAQGQVIGDYDFLIAAHAMARDLVLVSANVREFSRVPDLRWENWLA
ncbi:type II toxin-antitoxin system VapC family toxin [Zavarzinia sp. CC-PAN008]|uniref:type II toxin-antitoxin system VapC family toxin n=1 Tax=Zavarzinia sp. CC-PAN008 TaxID=3243332 RepID=UPI003F74882C